MLLAMAAGAWLMRPSSDAVQVWRATVDLPTGSTPRAEAVSVRLGSIVGSYLRADSPLVGRMLMPVPAGALIPAAAVGAAPAVPMREVTVPVDPQHAPVDLTSGMVVDVWGTPMEVAGSQAAGTPSLVLPRTVVAAVGTQPSGISGALSVVLEVPSEETESVLAAARTGTIDLVLIPVESP